MRTLEDARAWARGQVTNPSQDWYNLCQKFSRNTFGAAAWAPSAREAYNAIPGDHKHTSWPPPPGSIAYWGFAHAGSGHATPVFDVAYSNDIYRRGKIDPVKLTAKPEDMPFVTKWGLPYRGWIDWTPSGALPIAPKPEKVVKVADLIGPRAFLPSQSARLVNEALASEGYLPANLVRSYFGVRAQAEFRRWRRDKGFGTNTRAALTALGSLYGWSVL